MSEEDSQPIIPSNHSKDHFSVLKRIVRSTGIYAAAAFAQKGVSFLLLPVYTRFIDPTQYGVLEIINAFTAVAFLCLGLGLPAAINKCYHRDSPTPEDQESVLSTALWLSVPVVMLGTLMLWLLAPTIGSTLTGADDTGTLVRLAVLGGAFMSLTALFTASLRTRELALAFSVISLIQFVVAVTFNVILVVHFGMGIRGVLWGQLISQVITLPIAVGIAGREARWSPRRRLVGPLFRFGVLLVPAALAGWIINLSDRFLLGLLANLDEVAVYGVGYKIGMVLELIVVWPFQLSWPAVSFSISHDDGHQYTYSRVLTYLVATLTLGIVVLSLSSRAVIPVLVGEGYRSAYKVVPLIALGYALNGVRYCVSPGLHLGGKTKYLPVLMGAAAALNIGLNFALIPRFGMMGAGVATVLAFLFLAIGTGVASYRVYPVPYEFSRLIKVIAAGVLTYSLSFAWSPDSVVWSLAWNFSIALGAFPVILWLTRFFDDNDIHALESLLNKLKSRRPFR